MSLLEIPEKPLTLYRLPRCSQATSCDALHCLGLHGCGVFYKLKVRPSTSKTVAARFIAAVWGRTPMPLRSPVL